MTVVRKQYQKFEPVSQAFDHSKNRTLQYFKDECDINHLVDTWLKTGVMPVFNARQPVYADVTEIPSFEEAINLKATAEAIFGELTPEEQAGYGTPLDYLEAVFAAQENVGTDDPLDVTVPTDRNLENSARKEEVDGLSEKNEPAVES